MSVSIGIPPSLQTLIGGIVEVDVVGSTVGACLHELSRLHPQLKEKIFTRHGRLRNGINVFINGQNAAPRPLLKPVRDGDKVHIAYTVLGG
jgi:molybdopterin converting factor small subunit